MTQINASVITSTLIQFENILSQFETRLDNLSQLYYKLDSSVTKPKPTTPEDTSKQSEPTTHTDTP